MSLKAVGRAADVVSAPTVSGRILGQGTSRTKSRYPPGIEEIIGSSSKRCVDNTSEQSTDDGRQWLHPLVQNTEESCAPNPHGNDLSASRSQSSVPSSASVALWSEADVSGYNTPDTALSRTIDDRETSLEPPRMVAARTIQKASQNLRQTSCGMSATIKVYFHSKLLLNTLEVPAFRPFRKALDSLVKTLVHLEKSMADPGYSAKKDEIDYMMYRIQDSLDSVVDECRCILNTWDRREGGKQPDEPLEGKERRLRQMHIRDCNGRLEDLRIRLLMAEAQMVQEAVGCEPLRGKKMKWPKEVRSWLGYMRKPGILVGPSCDRQQQVTVRMSELAATAATAADQVGSERPYMGG